MTTRKAKAETKLNYKIGDQVKYNGERYRVSYLFGSKEQYAVIEDDEHRFSVRTKDIEPIE